MPRKTKQNKKQNNKKTQKKEIVLFISPMKYNNLIQVGGPVRLSDLQKLEAQQKLEEQKKKEEEERIAEAQKTTDVKLLVAPEALKKKVAPISAALNAKNKILSNLRKKNSPTDMNPPTDMNLLNMNLPVVAPKENVAQHIANIVKKFKNSKPTNIWFVTKTPEKKGDSIDNDIKKLQNLIQGDPPSTVIINNKPYLIKHGNISKNALESVKNPNFEYETPDFNTNLKTVLINNDETEIEEKIEGAIPDIFLTENQKKLEQDLAAIMENPIHLIEKNTQGGKRRKSKKIRKHRGIVQTGGSAGRLRKGYKYTGRRLKNGQAEIKKVKQTRK